MPRSKQTTDRHSSIGRRNKSRSYFPKAFADYFTSLATRPISNTSENWRYYCGAKVRWSGDLYVSPGAKRKDTATPFMPRIGVYDTLDPHVQEYHVLAAKTAGFRGFFCEYDTSKTREARVAATLARTAARLGFEIGLHWIPVNFTRRTPNLSNRNSLLKAAVAAIQDMVHNVYSIAGARVLGKYALLLFQMPAPERPPRRLEGSVFTRNEVQYLQKKAKNMNISIWISNFQPELIRKVSGFYPWVEPFGSKPPPYKGFDTWSSLPDQNRKIRRYYSNIKKYHAKTFSGIWPGFDDRKGRAWGEDVARGIPRESGRTLAATLAAVPERGISGILGVTWNDWIESTALEPGQEHGYQALKTLQRYLLPGTRDPGNLRLPEKLLRLRRLADDLAMAAGAKSPEGARHRQAGSGISAQIRAWHRSMDRIAGNLAARRYARARRGLTEAAHGLGGIKNRFFKRISIRHTWQGPDLQSKGASATDAPPRESFAGAFPLRQGKAGGRLEGRLGLELSLSKGTWIRIRQRHGGEVRDLAHAWIEPSPGPKWIEMDMIPLFRDSGQDGPVWEVWTKPRRSKATLTSARVSLRLLARSIPSS